MITQVKEFNTLEKCNAWLEKNSSLIEVKNIRFPGAAYVFDVVVTYEIEDDDKEDLEE